MNSIKLGGWLAPSFFILFFSANVFADTLILKDGKEAKGLIVEQHNDRIILSTENGEIPYFRKDIQEIEFDDPAQNFIIAAREYEAEGKLGIAAAYYEKALELNPNLIEAKKAVMGVRNRYATAHIEGPRNEVERKNAIYDSWSRGASESTRKKAAPVSLASQLKETLGMTLEKGKDWVSIKQIDSKKDAYRMGVRRGDRLVSIDGASLRYLSSELISTDMLTPPHASFILEIERDCLISAEDVTVDVKTLGLKLKQEYHGLIVESVKEDSIAAEAGIRSGDLISYINKIQTRYMPLKDALDLISESSNGMLLITVRRSVMLTRG